MENNTNKDNCTSTPHQLPGIPLRLTIENSSSNDIHDTDDLNKNSYRSLGNNNIIETIVEEYESDGDHDKAFVERTADAWDKSLDTLEFSGSQPFKYSDPF